MRLVTHKLPRKAQLLRDEASNEDIHGTVDSLAVNYGTTGLYHEHEHGSFVSPFHLKWKIRAGSKATSKELDQCFPSIKVYLYSHKKHTVMELNLF